LPAALRVGWLGTQLPWLCCWWWWWWWFPLVSCLLHCWYYSRSGTSGALLAAAIAAICESLLLHLLAQLQQIMSQQQIHTKQAPDAASCLSPDVAYLWFPMTFMVSWLQGREQHQTHKAIEHY
jgi:hypothetical protein